MSGVALLLSLASVCEAGSEEERSQPLLLVVSFSFLFFFVVVVALFRGRRGEETRI